jgi:type II secretory pathway pseudopilin PulG
MSRAVPKQEDFKLKTAQAFTLVELLAAVAVLTIIGILIVQITKAATDTTRLSNRAVDAAAQARLAFDRLALDISALVKRKDVDFQATNTPAAGAAALEFLSEVTSSGLASASNRGISLVAYQTATHADVGRLCLLRAGKAVAWSNPGKALSGFYSNGLPVRFGDAAFPVAVAGTDYDVLASGIIRMAVGFRLYPDDEAVTLSGAAAPLSAPARGQIVYAPPIWKATPSGGGAAVEMVDVSRIAALVVGVVAGDVESLKLASSAAIGDLAGAFPIPVNGAMPVETWQPMVSHVDALPASVPLAVRQGLKVFQRAFPVAR